MTPITSHSMNDCHPRLQQFHDQALGGPWWQEVLAAALEDAVRRYTSSEVQELVESISDLFLLEDADSD